MSLTEAIRDWILYPVMVKLNELQKEIHKMAESEAQFDVDLAALGSTLTTMLGLLAQIIAKSTAAGVDLTTEDTAVQSMTASVKTAVDQINAALNPPPPAA